ncbi:MAG: GGDEF domain-containing protein [Coriobacteriia bacterium]|nr:GGDEF domain-containing protein [Coriobacteriia bacterium]
MPDTERQPIGLHLAWLLAVAIAGSFVTAMILATGDLTTYWPLYIIPIVIASLGYYVPGAIVTAALSSAIVVLLSYGAGYDTPPTSALVLGMAAYAISGMVIGVQTQRYRRQRERLEQDATRDPLTGACRADYFDARIHEEVRRSSRYNQNFTLSLVGVSEFDEFQRLYGRVKGDLLLERLTEVLHLTVRSTDIVGRLDSALFAVIMPSTTAEEAQAVAERVVSAIGATEFEGDALEPVVHCNAQVVSATYPDDAAEADALMAAARDRLGLSEPRSEGDPGAEPRLGASNLADIPS